MGVPGVGPPLCCWRHVLDLCRSGGSSGSALDNVGRRRRLIRDGRLGPPTLIWDRGGLWGQLCTLQYGHRFLRILVLPVSRMEVDCGNRLEFVCLRRFPPPGVVWDGGSRYGAGYLLVRRVGRRFLEVCVVRIYRCHHCNPSPSKTYLLISSPQSTTRIAEE